MITLAHPVIRSAARVLLAALAGCNTVGTIGTRADSINRTTAAYSASAILYNIVRSKDAEPLNFVNLTGVTGHTTATIGLGLPTINIGAAQTPTQKLLIFGPNTVGGSEANDFVVNVVDDPGSYAALSRPVDPATIGFLINQYSNADLVFFLAVSRMQIRDRNGQLTGDYLNEPYVYDTSKTPAYGLWGKYNQGFFVRMLGYLQQGLTVSVDQGFVPSGSRSANATFCFGPRPQDDKPADPRAGNTCEPQDQRTPKPAKKPVSAAAAPATDDQAKPDWTFNDTDPANPGGRVHLYTRSVFGMYRFLGEILNLRELNQLPGTAYPGGVFIDSPQTEMLHVTHDQTNCWTTVSYDKLDWCVPNDAIGTKRTFSLLHQLFQLYATPNTQPATSTVRVTQ